MATIYLVTQGDYSAYSILGAFSCRENTQKYVDTFNLGLEEYDSAAEIEAYEIDKPLAEQWFDRLRLGNNLVDWVSQLDCCLRLSLKSAEDAKEQIEVLREQFRSRTPK